VPGQLPAGRLRPHTAAAVEQQTEAEITPPSFREHFFGQRVHKSASPMALPRISSPAVVWPARGTHASRIPYSPRTDRTPTPDAWKNRLVDRPLLAELSRQAIIRRRTPRRPYADQRIILPPRHGRLLLRRWGSARPIRNARQTTADRARWPARRWWHRQLRGPSFGCHSANPWRAKRLCPQAIVVPVRGERYSRCRGQSSHPR